MESLKRLIKSNTWKKVMCFVLAFILSIPFIDLPAKEAEASTTSENVIFISDTLPSGGDGSGKDANNPLVPTTGNSEVDANTALYQAIMKLKELGGGTIVFCGEIRLDNSNCEKVRSANYDFMIGQNDDAFSTGWPNVEITYTSVYNGVDYRTAENGGAKLVLAGNSSITFPTATKIENLTFAMEDTNNHYICGGRNPLHFGQGTYFEPYNNWSTANGLPVIVGGYNIQDGVGDSGRAFDITVDIGDSNKIGNIYGMYYNRGSGKVYHSGGVEINIESGWVIGDIYGDSKLGTSSNGVGSKAPITVNINGGIIGRSGTDIGGRIIGCDVGFDSSASDANKKVNINISGGDFTNCKTIQGYSTNVAEANRPAATVDLTALSTENATAVQAKIDSTTVAQTNLPQVQASNVIYISDVIPEGSDGSGKDADNPLAAPTGGAEPDENTALYKAMTTLMAEGGTIVFCGPVELNNTNCKQFATNSSFYDFMVSNPYANYKPDVTITYTSVYGGVDYRETANAELILSGGASITFPTATVMENITVRANSTTEHYISGGRNPLELGQGTNFVPYVYNAAEYYPLVTGAYRSSDGIADNKRACNITIDIGNENTIGAVYGYTDRGSKNLEGGVTITVKSGKVGSIYGDSHLTGQGGTKNPVTINIEGGIFRGVIAGVNAGFDSASADKTVNINILDGDFENCTGIMGNTPNITKNAPTSAVVDASRTSLSVARIIKARVNSTVTELILPSNFVDEGEQVVIYIKDGGTGDGTSADKALAAPTSGSEPDEKTALYKAWQELIGAGGGVVVICGPYTLNNDNCKRATSTSSFYDFMMPAIADNMFQYKPDITITYTSVWDGVDYRETANAELIMTGGSSITFPTATVTENLTVRSASSTAHYFAGGRNPMTLGQGTNFVAYKEDSTFNSYPIVLGGFRNQAGIGDTKTASTITIDAGNSNQIGNVYGACNGGTKTANYSGGITINVKSGKVGNIYGDSIIKEQLGIASAVTINIEGGILQGAVAGVNVGFKPASTDKNVKINITGGDFTDCTVIQGYTSQVPISDATQFVIPDSTTVDARQVSIEVARQIKNKVDPSVTTLLLPEGYTDSDEKVVIFIKDGATGDGSSASSPLKPTTGNYDKSATNPEYQKDSALYQAMEKLMKSGGGVIVICGPYTLDDTNCQFIAGSSADFIMDSKLYRPDLNITYTSVWNGVDYRKTAKAELIMDGKSQLTFPTGTTLENITVRTTNDVTSHFIAAGTNPLTLGKGTNFVPYATGNLEAYPTILGAFRSNGGRLKTGDANITVDIGNENTIGNIYGLCNGGSGHTGNVTINVKSGNVGSIYGDGRATGQTTIDGDITMNFSGGIYRGMIVGNNVGFAGNCSKSVKINVTGGDFSNCMGIRSATKAVTGATAASCIADCRQTTNEIAQQVKWVADSSVTVLLPEGFKENAEGRVIFIRDGGSGDGTSASSPLKPTTGNYDANAEFPERSKDSALYQAIEILMRSGGGTIVICGPYTLNDSNCQPVGESSADFIFPTSLYRPDLTIKYTSVWNGVDYRETADAELILDERASITFPTGTVLEDLTIRATDAVSARFIAAGTNPLTLAQGTNFIPYEEGKVDAYPMVLGGFRSSAGRLKTGDTNITVDIGDDNYIGNIYGIDNGGSGSHTGNVYITIKSGNIGGVFGDSRATGQVPINGDVNITIEGGIFRSIIAGVNVGFSGDCAKVVKMVITGGDFTKCTGIYAGTMAVSAVAPKECTCDLTGATIEVARQVKAVAMPSVKLILPDGYTDAPKNTTTEEEKEPVVEEESNPIGIIILGASGAGLLAVAAVVGILYYKKKKEKKSAE